MAPQHENLPSEDTWEDLQRDCHPFPAYVDYLYDRPCGYFLGRQRPTLLPSPPEQPQPISRLQFFSGHSLMPGNPQDQPGLHVALPSQTTTAQQFLRDFSSTSGNPWLTYAQALAPPSAPAAAQQGSVQEQAPAELAENGSNAPKQQKLHVLKPDELKHHQYNFLHDALRQRLDSDILGFYAVLNHPLITDEEKSRAQHGIVHISQFVAGEVTKHKLVLAMPNVWFCLKARQVYPEHHPDHIRAGERLHLFMNGLNENGRTFVEMLLQHMMKAEAEGKNALSVLPGSHVPQGQLTQTAPAGDAGRVARIEGLQGTERSQAAPGFAAAPMARMLPSSDPLLQPGHHLGPHMAAFYCHLPFQSQSSQTDVPPYPMSCYVNNTRATSPPGFTPPQTNNQTPLQSNDSRNGQDIPYTPNISQAACSYDKTNAATPNNERYHPLPGTEYIGASVGGATVSAVNGFGLPLVPPGFEGRHVQHANGQYHNRLHHHVPHQSGQYHNGQHQGAKDENQIMQGLVDPLLQQNGVYPQGLRHDFAAPFKKKGGNDTDSSPMMDWKGF